MMEKPARTAGLAFIAILIAVAALLGHFPRLNDRPMHTDEAVHAVKLGILMDKGTYTYNPHEYHGPVIYYSAVPFVAQTGAKSFSQITDERPLRLPIVYYGAMLVLAIGLSFATLGAPEALFAALIVACSPAFAFYSRYYIQEIPFVLFGYLALACGWKLLETAKVRWALGMGITLGVMVALKETWIMVLATAGFTAMLLHSTPASRPRPLPFAWGRFTGLFLLTTIVALAIGLTLLTNIWGNPAALRDTFAAIGQYVSRGVSGDSSTFGANVHDHPWDYYIRLLAWPDVDGPWIWTEGGTLILGIIGLGVIIGRWNQVRAPWHFVAIFTILLSAFYSAIPYKTPWNVLPMLLGWCLLAGRGCAALVRMTPWAFVRVLTAIVLLAWPAALAYQSWLCTIKRPADVRNPYAYSPTSPSVLDLATRAEKIADVAPEHHDMVIQIVSPANDYWPLPWYLRRFDKIGYYTDNTKLNRKAAMVISTGDLADDARARLGERQDEVYGLRPDVLLNVYIRQDLWDAFMEKLQAKSAPAP